jgi:hypothetical protein
MPGRGESEGVRLLAEFTCDAQNQARPPEATAGSRGVNEGVGQCVEFVVDLGHAPDRTAGPLPPLPARQAQDEPLRHHPRTQEQMQADLVHQVQSCAGAVGITSGQLRYDQVVSLSGGIVSLIVSAGTRPKDRRRLARAVVEFCFAVRAGLLPSPGNAPDLIVLLRYIMEDCIGLPGPSSARLRDQHPALVRCLELPAGEAATEAAYQRLVTLYRLRPAWATLLGLSWLFP